MATCIFILFNFLQNVRSVLVSKVIPAIQGKCLLISSKVSFGTQEGTSLEERWLQICQKRDECGEAVKKIKGMAFFSSSVAVVEKKVTKNSPKRRSKKKTQQKM